MTATARRAASASELVDAVAVAGERTISVPEADRHLADPASIPIIGFDDGAAAGYAIAYLVTRIDGAPMVMLYDLTVSPDHRRHGVARAMIQAVVSAANSSGASRVWTVTERDNTAARATYAATGAAGDGDDLVMSWDLS